MPEAATKRVGRLEGHADEGNLDAFEFLIQ
jgi:hypothetical protein